MTQVSLAERTYQVSRQEGERNGRKEADGGRSEAPLTSLLSSWGGRGHRPHVGGLATPGIGGVLGI